MFGLRLLVRVSLDKRQELTDALLSAGRELEPPPCRVLIMQGFEDRSLFCWMGDWHARQDLEAFLRSDDYRALRGAADVLGALEDVWIAKGVTP